VILTRRVGETVMIGDEVTVTVLRVKGNQVRLGVNAPKSVSVQREDDLSSHQARKYRAPAKLNSTCPGLPAPAAAQTSPNPSIFCPARPACV